MLVFPFHENDCTSFLRYTSIPTPTTVTETFGKQSTLTLVDIETLVPKTDEATTTQPDETATTILKLEPETFLISITPTRTVTITVTPDPLRQTEINTKTVVNTDFITHAISVFSKADYDRLPSSTVETFYYSNLGRCGIIEQPAETIIKPTNIPSYATACADPEQYSSACACLGIEVSTIEGAGSFAVKTVNPKPTTVFCVETATRPAVTITTTLPAKTQTVTVTHPAPQATESTTLEATTVEVSTTAEQDTVVTTQEATHVDKTTSLIIETRSVSPICSTYTSSSHCDCKYEIICGQQININLSKFQRKIDFNTFTSSFEECMDRCDANPGCQFGDFASLLNGELCSTYSGNPGTASRSGGSGTYFEKGGNVLCTGYSG